MADMVGAPLEGGVLHRPTTGDEDGGLQCHQGILAQPLRLALYATPYRTSKYEIRLRRDPVVMWQDRYYWPIVVSGLLLPFLLGVWHGGWQGGIGAPCWAGSFGCSWS